MGQTCSNLVKQVAPDASLATIVAEADLQDVHRALQERPHKICASFSGSLGTPLHVAAAHGRTECVELLVQQATALAQQQAASNRYDASNRHLYVAYKMVNTGNDRKQTPLMLASGQGHEQCVALLLDLGAERWAADSLGGRTALHYAARLNQPQVVTALLKGAGPPPAPAAYPNTLATPYVNARTMAGFTPLHLAVHTGALEAAAALVRGGAALTGRSLHDGEGPNCAIGATPLHLAAQRGDRDMVLLLLTAWAHLPAGARDADLRTIYDSEGQLPSRVAATRGHRLLLPLLDPAQPLSAVLACGGAVALGPPRLARLAADVLRAKVSAALEAAAAAAAPAPAHAAAAGSCAAPEETSGEDCPVCLEPLGGPGCAGVVLAPCRHALCLACCWEMHQVLQDASDATRCPLCRSAVCDVTPLR